MLGVDFDERMISAPLFGNHTLDEVRHSNHFRNFGSGRPFNHVVTIPDLSECAIDQHRNAISEQHRAAQIVGDHCDRHPGIGDHAAGLSLTCGILSALRTRDQTGEGQVVDVSLFQIGLYVFGNDVALGLVAGQTPKRHDRTGPLNPLWNQYQTQDRRWLFLVMIDPDRYWAEFCAAIERPELLEDERFTDIIMRYKNSRELVKILDKVFLARSLAQWEKQLGAHNVIWSPVREIGEILDDPQARAMGYFRPVEHPTAGPFVTVGPPLRLSGHEMPADRPAPALGADSEAVLSEAGLSPDEIATALGDPQ